MLPRKLKFWIGSPNVQNHLADFRRGILGGGYGWSIVYDDIDSFPLRTTLAPAQSANRYRSDQYIVARTPINIDSTNCTMINIIWYNRLHRNRDCLFKRSLDSWMFLVTNLLNRPVTYRYSSNFGLCLRQVICIALILLGYWRPLAAIEFRTHFGVNSSNLIYYMILIILDQKVQ